MVSSRAIGRWVDAEREDFCFCSRPQVLKLIAPREVYNKKSRMFLLMRSRGCVFRRERETQEKATDEHAVCIYFIL